MKGLEIAPYHSPITAKAEGYNVKILDVLDTESLKSYSRKNSYNEHSIEHVDYVGDACEMKKIVGESSFDYIVSSHNFEHLGNPIKFLNAVESLLTDDGVCSMAVPDYRFVFDVHKYPTRIVDFLRRYHNDSKSADPFDDFSFRYQHVAKHKPQSIIESKNILDIHWAHKKLLEQLQGTDASYSDSHVSYFTPTSLLLLFKEMNELGYTNLEVIEIEPTSFEIIFHVKKTNKTHSLTESERSGYHFKILEEMYEAMKSYKR